VRQLSDRSLIAILALSVLLRVGVALYLGDVVDAPPLLTDQRSYHALAVRLLKGHGYSFDRGWYPFTPPDTPTAHWSFLYSLFVAAVYALFGTRPLAARLVQGVLGGMLLPWMVYRLARVAFGTGEKKGRGDEGTEPPRTSFSSSPYAVVPLIAAAIAAIYGYFVLYAATLMTETFYVVALLWSLEVGLKVSRLLQDGKKPSILLALQLGLSLGLATLLRQSILPWVPVLFAYLLWQAWRERRLRAVVRTLAIASSILGACILPWTYRNARVYGQFLLLNSNVGYALYSAQHPIHGTRFREFEAAPLPEGLPWGNEAAMDRALMRAGIQLVLGEPDRYLLLTLSRLRAFFEFWPTPDTTLLHNAGRVGSFGLFLPFMLYGLYLVVRHPRFVVRCALLFLFVVFYTVMHLLTWAMVRYRLPVDAVLIPLAALAALDLAQRARSVKWRRTSF
jgi:hypothetical protein